MAERFGWSLDYIMHMPLRRFNALLHYLQEYDLMVKREAKMEEFRRATKTSGMTLR